MHPTTVYQSNSNRPDSSCILVLCLQHRFVCCSSSHNPLISSGLGSDMCLIHHHPNRPQRTNLIPEPRRQHMDTSDTKPRTFILTALESEPIVLTEGYAKKTHICEACCCSNKHILEVNCKRKETVWVKQSLSESMRPYRGKLIMRMLMEEGNVDKTRRQAEGSCSRPKDNHMTAFLAQTAVASICNIHDLLLFSSSSML